ncbi:MAG: ABC-F family ATP-binding cassette domain-containing protein [Ktedonobacterales bacterium]|nr:ABC-F family ATP-binding cassette domain-containing protein [Ktedonobacterales bacterium]
MLLQVAGVVRAFGAVTVLDGINLVVNRDDRLGIVGSNGAGKSTLLRIIAGADGADAGSVTVPLSVTVGYLPQTTPDFAGATLADLIRTSVGDLRALEGRLQAVATAMATAEGDALAALLDEYGTLASDFADRDGYDLDHRIDTVLAGLGLAGMPHDRVVATLSGGEKARVGLAALLLRHPDLLLLDEPTNHLDFATMAWLESYLADYHGGIVIVSHDRQFLNRAVNSIGEIDDHAHTLKRYSGNYDAYAAAKQAERGQWEAEYARQQEELRELRHRIRDAARQVAHNRRPKDGDKFIYNFKGENVQSAISRNVRQAEEQLARIEADPVPKPPKLMRFTARFGADALRSDTVVQVVGLSKRYGARVVLDDISFTLGAGGRMLLVAPNGAGKTTLLRLLLGHDTPDAGSVRLVASAAIGYLPQEPDLPDPTRTVLAEYGRGLVGLDEQFIAGLIGYGFFRLEDMTKQVRQLSLGQQRKLELARLIAARPNVLILDEPTNYLSLDVVEAFETAIATFPGPVLAVSHDRWFIDRFQGEVWALAEGRLVRRD